ncbi:MAG: DoxX family protein [Xanthobacteraceae bacterium]|nr:DoxX family protein [Xanthobacteraceae bacterium]
METTIDNATPASAGRMAIWSGRVLSGLVVALLTLDGAIKLVPLSVVTDTMAQLGWQSDVATARLLGTLTLGATLLYALPRTAVLGAILLTAYLGGAVATHVRIGSPLFSHVLFGVYLGAMLWGGLWLRNLRVRALFS